MITIHVQLKIIYYNKIGYLSNDMIFYDEIQKDR
jgi:hypothetical protein